MTDNNDNDYRRPAAMSPVYDSSLMGGSSRSPSRHDGSILPSSSSITTPSRTHDANDRDDVITRELKRLRSDLNDLHPDACAAAATAVDAAAIVLPGDYYCTPTPNDNSDNNNINAPLLTSDVSTILSKIQEITKYEYTIIVHQRDEICRLRSELHLLQQQKQQQQQQQQQHDDRFSEKMIGSSSNKSEAPTSQLVVQSAFSFSDSITMESTHSDGTTSSRSNGSSKSSSSSSSSSPPSFSSYDEFSANEGSAISERNTPYTLTTTTTTNDAQQLLSTSHSLLSQSTIANSTIELRTINERKGEAIAHREELTCNIQRATANLDQLTITNERLQVEVQTKQNLNAKLEKERNKLMGELEIYNDQIELHTLLTHARNANVSLASKVEELQLRLMKEKEKNGMLLLQQGEDATTVLMMGERDEGGDDDDYDYDIHDEDINHDDNNNEERDDIEEQRGGSNNDDEFGRERSFTGGSDTVSALHDADTISILFDQDLTMIQQQQVSLTTASSIKSDHDSIRLHAEKMLYWANRAEERSAKKKMKSSSSSVASLAESSSMVDRNTTTTLNNGSDVDPDGNTGATKPTTILSVESSTTATMIPMTIGLPPRSQSRVHRSSRSLLLPPRCPTPPNMSVASSSSITTTGTTTNPTLSPQCSSSTMSCNSDKENGNDMGVSGGNGGFVSGAFPKFARRSRSSHKTVRMTEIPVTIGHPDDVDEDANFVVHRQHQQQQQNQQMVCECKASPFSGNDAQSEFYLPKLGLACNCGYDVDIDRANFSKDPTSLTNVLRKWQCDFLASLGVHTANELLHAHKGDANGMARKMKEWRSKNSNINMSAGSSGGNNDSSSCGGGVVVVGGGVGTQSRECYVALKIWSRTCKVVLRSIREQKHRARLVAAAEGGTDSEYDSDGVIIEKPHFLDISFADGTNTITSISTLGQFSSVCGGRSFEMMEI